MEAQCRWGASTKVQGERGGNWVRDRNDGTERAEAGSDQSEGAPRRQLRHRASNGGGTGRGDPEPIHVTSSSSNLARWREAQERWNALRLHQIISRKIESITSQIIHPYRRARSSSHQPQTAMLASIARLHVCITAVGVVDVSATIPRVYQLPTIASPRPGPRGRDGTGDVGGPHSPGSYCSAVGI